MTVKDQNKKQLILKGNVGDTNYKNKDRISNQSDLAAEYYDNLNGVKPIDDTIQSTTDVASNRVSSIGENGTGFPQIAAAAPR